jgi:hypothetical protein
MNKKFYFIALFIATFICNCDVIVDNPRSSPNDHTPNDTSSHNNSSTNNSSNQRITRSIVHFFPFEDNNNIWNYTESEGNKVTILVADTISDDGVTYFRVSFRENRVDTTDDWFSRSASGINFGQSLTGPYELFLPAKIDSTRGSFKSRGSKVEYTYYDSLKIDGSMFHKVLHLAYQSPIIHGFDEITLADSIGVVELIDHTGRWPIDYTIDSCHIGGNSIKF